MKIKKATTIVLISLIFLLSLSYTYAQDLNDENDELNLDSNDLQQLEMTPPSDDESSDETLLASESTSDTNQQAYLVLDNDADKENIYLGDTVTWIVSVLNKGPDTAKNVKVSDQLPDGLKYIKHTTTKGTFDPASGIWDIGDLSVDDGEVFLNILTKSVSVGEKINKAKLTSDTDNLNDNESYEEEEIDVFENSGNSESEKLHKSAHTVMHPTSNPIALIVISLFAILISFKRIRI